MPLKMAVGICKCPVLFAAAFRKKKYYKTRLKQVKKQKTKTKWQEGYTTLMIWKWFKFLRLDNGEKFVIRYADGKQNKPFPPFGKYVLQTAIWKLYYWTIYFPALVSNFQFVFYKV